MAAPMKGCTWSAYRQISSSLSLIRATNYRFCTTKLKVHYATIKIFTKSTQSLQTGHKVVRKYSCLSDTIRNFHTESTARKLSANRPVILGIETSCDDTGAAVVDGSGEILGEELNSQERLHVQFGGILPPLASNLHRENIAQVVDTALSRARMTIQDVDAVATTTHPGLPMSLTVGLEHTRTLIAQSGKPFIPIHHMEAHALTARMIHRVDFPFLVLLISGGHCLLAVARGVHDFIRLGHCIDISPGDCLDKTARRLKLKNLPAYSGVSGGRAVELAARGGQPLAYPLVTALGHHPDCNFSFGGLRSHLERLIERLETEHDIRGGAVLPAAIVADVCAHTQYLVTHHLAKRVQRALLFCQLNGVLPHTDKTLVVSGGVASNEFIRRGLEYMCTQYDCRVVCPPPQLCTDNGVMIAWNGVEKYRAGVGFADVNSTQVTSKVALGADWTERVSEQKISLPRVKLSHFFLQTADKDTTVKE